MGGAPEGGVRIVTREALAPLLILHFVNLISPPKRPPTTGVRRTDTGVIGLTRVGEVAVVVFVHINRDR